MGKDKKEKRKSEGEDGEDEKAKWEERVQFLNPISKPLASRKLTKKLYKTIKKGENNFYGRRGYTVLCRPLVLTLTEKVSVATECLYA